MAIARLVPRNQTQTLGLISANGTSAIIGATSTVTVYTCPAGKVAEVVTFSLRVTGLGNGTQIDARVAANITRRFVATNDAQQSVIDGNPVLAAGEAIDLRGNAAGDNASGVFMATLRERPA